MKNKQMVIAWLLVLCLTVGLVNVVAAEEWNAMPSDFETLYPVMDIIAGAIKMTYDDPQSVPGGDGILDAAFLKAFFTLGVTTNSLGITTDMLADPAKQAAFLGTIFAAKAPELTAMTEVVGINGYLGFRPVTVSTATDNGNIQIVGELYWAVKPLKDLTDSEYGQVQWLDDRGVFTFQKDNAAQNGYRVMGFSLGTELSMEMAVQHYFEEILVEYVNTNLGFSVQYPSIFADELLVEDAKGVSAALSDGSVSFFAKRVDNSENSDLQNYSNVIANGIPGAVLHVNEMLQSATILYVTAEGRTVFNMYIVTDKYIYQAELSYLSELSELYHLYTIYIENTFTVNEVSVG